MADYDQEVSEYVLKTRDGINQLALYNSSIGRLVLVLVLPFSFSFFIYFGIIESFGSVRTHLMTGVVLFRFQNALGALIYPIYGQGELPQAFCRRAAVKGCLYVRFKGCLLLYLP